MTPLLPLTVCASTLTLPGCAAEPAAPLLWRVTVKLAQPATDADAIVAQAAKSSGVPVTYLASVSDRWHSLGLRCGDDAQCSDALRRLQADTLHFDSVERSQRQQAHMAVPPRASSPGSR